MLVLDTSGTNMEASSHPAMMEIQRSFWCGWHPSLAYPFSANETFEAETWWQWKFHQICHEISMKTEESPLFQLLTLLSSADVCRILFLIPCQHVALLKWSAPTVQCCHICLNDVMCTETRDKQTIWLCPFCSFCFFCKRENPILKDRHVQTLWSWLSVTLAYANVFSHHSVQTDPWTHPAP